MQPIDHSPAFKHSIPGLFAVINISQKKVEVRHTTNINKAIATILDEIKRNIPSNPAIARDFHNQEISFLYLEEISDPQLQRLRQVYWIRYYERLGYQFYSKKLALVLRPVIRIETYQTQCFITVRLQKKHNDSFCVGVFKSHKEAQDFIEQFYSSPEVYSVIYSTNSWTKKYIEFQQSNPWENPIKGLL